MTEERLTDMARSHRPSFKGCCAMCASGKGKVRGQGDAARMPAREQRQFGKTARLNRRDIPASQWEERSRLPTARAHWVAWCEEYNYILGGEY